MPERCLCGSGHTRSVRLGAAGGFRICTHCGLIARAEPPPAEDLAAFYGRRYWPQYETEQLGGGRDNVQVHAWRWIRAVHPAPGFLVDVGCGAGTLLALGRADGWKTVGYELSEQAVEHARAQGLDAGQLAFPPCPLEDGVADAVTCVNVLDHLPNPLGALAEIARIVKPGGLVYVRVPNGPLHLRLMPWLRTVGLPHMGVFHLYGFGQRALIHHLTRLGFAIVDARMAPPSRRHAYGAEQGVTRLVKRLDHAWFALAGLLGLRRRLGGPSVEVLARKAPHATRQEVA